MPMINVTPTPPVDIAAACRRGIAHAGRALGDLVGLGEPQVDEHVAPFAGWEALTRLSPAAPMVVIGFAVDGGLPGHLVAFLPEKAASQIAERLVGGGQCDISNLDATFLGALSETGNIVASAFLNGVAETVGQACWPSVPDVHVSRKDTDLQAIVAQIGVEAHPHGAYVLRADVRDGLHLRFAVVVAPAQT